MIAIMDIMDGDLGKQSGYHRNGAKCVYMMGKTGRWEEVVRRRRILNEKYNLQDVNILIHPDDVELKPTLDREEVSEAKLRYGVKLLGSYIGSDEYIDNQLQVKLHELQEEATRLIENTYAQDGLVLFQRCFNLKINYLMRTMPPYRLQRFIAGFEAIQRAIVQHLVGADITDQTFRRMKLAINQSGLGLGFLPETSHASYIASIVATQDSIKRVYPQLLQPNEGSGHQIASMISFEESVTHLQQSMPELTVANVFGELATTGKTLQAKFTEKMVHSKLEEFLADLHNPMRHPDRREIPLVHGAIDDHAGAWMLTIPKTELLRMSDQQVAVALRNRFYIDQCCSPTNLCCDCQAKTRLDPKGYHICTCHKGGGAQRTHDELKNYICNAGCYSGFQVKAEMRYELDKVRPDLTFQRGTMTDGRPVHADLTVTNTLRGRSDPACKRQTLALLTKKGWAAERAAHGKIQKYKAACAQMNSSFIPLVFESTGHMHNDVIVLLKTISSHASESRKIPAHVLFQYHINHLSVILQRGIADAMLRRSAQIQGGVMIPFMRHIMSYDNIMLHDRAYVDRM